MKRTENEQKIIRIIATMNLLKNNINPAHSNKLYGIWMETDRKVKFRSYVIEKAKKDIIEIIDSFI